MKIAQYLLLLSVGVWIAWIDLRTHKIPNVLLLIFAGLATSCHILKPSTAGVAIACAVVFAIFIIPISLITSRSLGAGDAKFIILLALLIGRGSQTLSALIIGSLFALLHMSFESIRQRELVRSIPFAPSLVIGALLAL